MGGNNEYFLKDMLDTPKTDLSRLMGAKWFLSLEKLAERADVPIGVVLRAVRGERLHPSNERKIRKVLNEL